MMAPAHRPPFTEVAAQADFPQLEEQVLEFWEEHQTFVHSVESREEEKSFVFYDGPPFASGLPHYGHLLASIIKDVVPRFWTMRGYRVPRRFGWDCHGLPVENEAEQQLGLRSRRDIIDFGVDRFNESCRDLVLRFTGEWKQFIQRVGRWVDWSNQYRTMDVEFMESVWWVFKSLWDAGLIYEGFKSLAYCPRCATPLSNFEVNQGYQETQDPSVTIRFNVVGEENTQILAWTTTPWTLPSNLALAVGLDIDYVRVTMEDGEQLILAGTVHEKVLEKERERIVAVEPQPVDELLHMHYEPLFDYFAEKVAEGAFRVVAADFVSTEDGTGIVHIAPGFGEDDYQLGVREGLTAVCPIDKDCCFTDEVGDYAGQFVKEADSPIVRRLRQRGQLFSESTIMHSYPFCWRCDSPLIYRTVSTWFVHVEKIKERMVAANQQIWWVPEHIKDGRFGKSLEAAPDWAVSRNRYWGTPLPIWRNEETGETLCIGSREELETLCGHTVDDLHKHVINGVELPGADDTVLRRVPEVLDCWFESGSMPYAQNHYPFENADFVEANFPADFISEGLDQTRGWFYTLTVLAAALFDKPAFKNCIVSGMLLAEDGRKMSKRLKNYPEPSEMLDKYGADALRLYLLNSAALKAQEMRMTEVGIRESLRAVIIPLWSAYNFFVKYANVDEWSPAADSGSSSGRSNHHLDRWIISELQTLVHDINEEMEAYRLYRTVPAMVAFVDKLTNWYIRRSRRRFWKSENDEDKAAAYATLYEVLVQFVKSLAPVLPFITETIYQNLVRRVAPAAPESVHLCDMPQAREALRDFELEEQMQLAMQAVALGRSLRSKHNLRIRQPLQRLMLLPPNERSKGELAEMSDLIADELNIKDVVLVDDETSISKVSYKANFRLLGPRFGKRMKEVAARISALTPEDVATLNGGGSIPVADGEIGIDDIEIQRREREDVVVAVDNNLCVGLDIHLNAELIGEGRAREFVNRVQNMRKEAGLDVADRIRVWLHGSAPVEESVEKHSDYISAETLAVDLQIGPPPDQVLLSQDWQVDDEPVSIAIDRA